MLRQVLLAVVLLIAGVLVVAGVAGIDAHLALVVGGALLAGWGWLLLGEVAGDPTGAGE